MRQEQRASSKRDSARRAGATLLEVMWSMGIIAIGLAGVLSVFPVAGNRVSQGTIIDGADRLGRNAIRQFDLQGMRRSDLWTKYETNSTPQQYIGYNPVQNVSGQQRAQSFCIDPLFISTFVPDPKNPPQTIVEQTEYFPYLPFYQASDARMDRISLRAYPGSPLAMSLNQAVQQFMAQDDIEVDLPDDRTLEPEQKYDPSRWKRQFEGKFTWMATLTPRVEAYQDDLAITSDTYVLSIVVFHRRDMDMTMHLPHPTKEGSDNERVVSVPTFYSNGFAGGDVQLQTISRQPPPDTNGSQESNRHWAEDLNLKRGQWVMLSAKINATSGASANWVSVFRWYRVLAVDDVANGAADGSVAFTRNVTLQGPDWTDVVRRGSPTQATLLNNVVAVYEKTIRLETSSLWTDL